ncbi:MAG TPA: NTP transferase domain-containing protein [Candidatus Coprenecus stercoravium]|uniref:NTP transferase domain-containing protein n=1 Tax=Candidatus Coprenecus stercoravium TaxID=2840735 RepID=A0A9D2K810_9BACT|nr:NTP transferase domain-containing protein [Candidatus Coprenecus stercoravium]
MTATAMILAAGLGTRLRPITDSMPKALVPYRGVPMIESLILRLKAEGFSRIVINVHHFADMIEDYIRSRDCFGADISFSDERNLLLDTGGGIRHAAMNGLLDDGPVLVHNVDIISDISLSGFYEQACGLMRTDTGTVAALLVSGRSSSRYLLTDPEGRLRGWTYPAKGLVKGVEPSDIPSLTPLAFSGIHIISPEIVSLMEDWPDKFSIIDFYLSIASTHTVQCINAPDGAEITDIGKLSRLH